MPTTSATFYLRNVRLAQGQVTYTIAHPPYNAAYFCRSCGDIWARLTFAGSALWDVKHQACERHLPVGVIDWACVPGSFLGSMVYPESQGFRVTDFPRAVLLREFDLHMHHFKETYDVQD